MKKSYLSSFFVWTILYILTPIYLESSVALQNSIENILGEDEKEKQEKEDKTNKRKYHVTYIQQQVAVHYRQIDPRNFLLGHM